MPDTITDKWANLRTHPISAQNFKDPLLLVLGEKTNFKANQPIEFNSVYAPICEMMGITLEQYGKPKSADMYWVERWIQEAFKALIRFKWATRMGRGQWALTSDGVTRALTLKSKTSDMGDAVETVETVEEIPEIPRVEYHEDPYIRALAIQEVSCFGIYSATSTTCMACPLQFSCINAQAAELSRLNIQLLAEAEAAKAPKKPEVKLPEPTTDPYYPPSSKPLTSKTARLIEVPVEHPCAKCGKSILVKSQAVWVRSGEDAAVPAGMYHTDCYNALTQRK